MKDNGTVTDASMFCAAAYHKACPNPTCDCICHIHTNLIPPETSTPLPPQLDWIYDRKLGHPKLSDRTPTVTP